MTPEVWLLLLTLLLTVAVVLLYIRCCYQPFQVLRKNGIPGPTPALFYGNYKQTEKMGVLKYLEQSHKEYGPNVGYYLGRIPQLSTMDLDLIKLVCIKDFDLFINRQRIPDAMNLKPTSRGLLRSRDKLWRTSRQALSPTFSPFKMKAMTPLIQSSVDSLVKVLGEHSDTKKSVEVFRVFGSFTMETLFATAFGRVMDIQGGVSDELTEAAASVFSSAQEGQTTSLLYLITVWSHFPWIEYILQSLGQRTERGRAYSILQDTALQLVKQRRQATNQSKYKDLLQLMIEATVEDTDSNQRKTSRQLTDEEIVGHSIIFMLAGYETTANTLSYVCYLLALNPNVQEKLQEEIDKYHEEHPEASSYQATQDLEYLDMVIQESLRLYPPAPLFVRETAADYKYENITIPKGCSVVVPVKVLHRSPDYWTDPDTFNPLRFNPDAKAERPQQCYLPFGYGPRSCIGMRFALLEAKMALIEMLKKFSFVRAPDTQVPLETVFGVTMTPKNGIFLQVASRET